MKNVCIAVIVGVLLGSSSPAAAQTALERQVAVLIQQVNALVRENADLKERMEILEYKTQDIVRGVSVDGRVPFVQFNSRVGINTRYFPSQPLGEGAVLSVGNNSDPFGVYIENEPEDSGTPLDRPSIGLYVASLRPSRPEVRQPNIGIVSYTMHSPYGNIPFWGAYQFSSSPIAESFPNEGLRLSEVRNGDTPGTLLTLKRASFLADGIKLRDGEQKIVEWTIEKDGISRRLW